jgi:hypothetical protein
VSYVVLDAGDGTPYALRLEEIDAWRMRLQWIDPEGPALELVRHAPLGEPAVA